MRPNPTLNEARFMVWQPEVEELARRRAFAEQMGGEAGIAEQRRRGKLTVRERVEMIADPGTFAEIGGLAGAATYEGNDLVNVRPSNMVIGTARLDGRPAVVTAGDFTVRGGSADGSHRQQGRPCPEDGARLAAAVHSPARCHRRQRQDLRADSAAPTSPPIR